MAPQPDQSRAFQAPRGTRDFYPIELARRRWIEEKWRRTAVRHGFEEIDGPTFEHLDLYTVKSGEGIVSELFSFTRQGGDTRFALRPEFTPTLARLAAARANALPKPTKWFSVGPYFRAERPQRGRLREFLQWNVDVIGDDSAEADAELILCCIDLLRSVGLIETDVRVKVSHRNIASTLLQSVGIPTEDHENWLPLLDRWSKISNEAFIEDAGKIGGSKQQALKILETFESELDSQGFTETWLENPNVTGVDLYVDSMLRSIQKAGEIEWVDIDRTIVRGLAYYTGTVFEVHEATGAERAIAGGGRYDNLIELFDGPPTPAVGFAMGDVVLSLVLQDKGLMPTDEQIAQDLGLRPDVFVIPTADTEHLIKPLVARLRREGMHARHTYKSTRNVGKLLKEAGAANAKLAVILESAESATLKDLDSGEQRDVPIDGLVDAIQESQSAG